MGIIRRTILKGKPQVVVSLFLLGLALALWAAPVTHAATDWTVSPGNAGACTAADPKCGTVAAALKAAGRGDTIHVAAGTYTENITLTRDVTMIGAGAGTTVLDGGYGAGCTGQAPLIKGVMVVLSGVTAHVSDLTLQHGCIIETGDPIIEGGGLNNHGTTYLARVIVSDNTVRGPLGGGGGISNETNTGVLYLTDVIIANNTAEEGAGLDNDRYATLTNVSIFGNKAVGVRRGEGEGGGIENDTLVGAAITMTNVTLYANQARVAGGAMSVDATTLVTATNLTVDQNIAPHAGGIKNEGTVHIRDSIIANSAGGNCVGAIVASGKNLSTDGSCGGGFAVVTNPGLSGVLAANGGFAPSEALVAGSPAIDADVACAAATSDQRGQARPTDGSGKNGPACDVGAYEYVGTTPRPVAAPTITPGPASAQ